MSLLPTTPSTTPTSSTKTSNTSNSSASSTSQLDLNNQIAGNFNEFLGLLTTQLQNQDPLSPMDTNQFTQQLVEFASVEQQINMNTNLQTLVTLQQTAQDSQALGFVGQTVTVNGATVFTQSGTVQPGSQQFTWNGQNNSGQQQPAGNYTLKITATDANGKSVAVPTTVTGVVQSVDLSKNPPELNIGGQNYTVNQIVNVTQSSNSLSSLQSSLSNISSQLGTLTSQLSSLL